MDNYWWIYVIAILVLVAFAAFFSAAETAFSSLNRIRLRHLAMTGNKKAERTLELSDKYDKLLVSLLVGNNIANIVSSSVATILFCYFFPITGALISTVTLTAVILIFGEVVPKNLGKDNSENIALAFTPLVRFFMVFFSPIIALLTFINNFVNKIYKPDNEQPSVTEQELKVIVEEIKNEGVLEEKEGDLVRSALDFDEVDADRILTPRVDIVGIKADEDIEAIKDTFLSTHYSRMPVYEDNVDNIIGVLYEKDFFRHYIIDKKKFDVKKVMQATIYVPPKKKISELLTELQSLKSHFAVVTDQYGGTLGIVTLEDILEQLVGEIWDEYDDVVEDVVKLSDNKYSVNPDMDIHEMIEELALPFRDFDPERNSVGGWVLDTLENIPQKGDKFDYENITVTVTEVEENRIKALKLVINSSNKD